ncbi:tagaturonate epimerase family protein [Deinococcus cellulosilyticus]|uniref:Tagaturonate/fructuronate epimerase n=1 Tax=Deinococcus cellulosilyticus (strain DSM 18568 / NBRC 106333 / KACC 11606 / 5516J-15) TaxID=1223518 RepID=A0A511N0A4_DEIC1|nr:tagaturonate epimerase family protein [Deinococcus cellulosilyticus]GEM46325.1 hypothetical protein DC3_19600 [Deinococcus cellulosilyticus NBRC 106333 = KACC 11606]
MTRETQPPPPAPTDPYPESRRTLHDFTVWMGQAAGEKQLFVQGPEHPLQHFQGDAVQHGPLKVLQCPLSSHNAKVLREILPNLKPQPLGLATSAGFGDRLGVATPGHVQALQAVGGRIRPIFAQQSIREMARTGRTPQQVLDDATWGAFQAGWTGTLGADADHLKTPEDIDRCAAAGFTFFTLDPSGHVDNAAGRDSAAVLQEKLGQLPWAALDTSETDLQRRYRALRLDLGHRTLTLDEEAITRAAVKYLPAVQQIQALFQHLQGKNIPFELEISVDEGDAPTTPAEHVFLASELKRLGVSWVSLAPRFIGSFEKGVDYIGDVDLLNLEMQDHALIARRLGPYKLSLHSGSDKFSIYPIAMHHTQGLVHLKTAGTSYLEALRVVAVTAPDLFTEMLEVAKQHFEEDRASYHISGKLDRVPVQPGNLPALLDHFDTRQVLHVTFGTLLQQFREPLMQLMEQHETLHLQGLREHFIRHLAPFAGA